MQTPIVSAKYFLVPNSRKYRNSLGYFKTEKVQDKVFVAQGPLDIWIYRPILEERGYRDIDVYQAVHLSCLILRLQKIV